MALILLVAGFWSLSSHASPERFRELRALASDDPKRAVAVATEVAGAAADDETRFWALLARGNAQDLLELEAEPEQSYAQAEQVLARWDGSTEVHRLWLASSRLLASSRIETPRLSQDRLNSLKTRLRNVSDSHLSCEVTEIEVYLLLDVGSLDEAWLATEEWERCARALGMSFKEAWATSYLGTIASKGQGRTQAEPDTHFARALATLGDRPARTLRSALLYQRAESERSVGRLDAAAAYYRDSIALGREVGDEAAIAAGAAGLAAIHLKQLDPQAALPFLLEARAILEPRDSGYRMLHVAYQLVQAYTQLKSPKLPDAIALARRYDSDASPGPDRASVARALAAAYASQGRYKEAYAETQRAEALSDEGRRLAAEIQNLRLQARYSAAKREAENADLRHRSESASLALAAEEATRRTLWAAVVTLVVLLLAAAGWLFNGIARRRALADLALRDDLTGQPNRRAVTRYAKEQFALAQKSGTPLTIALVDLDHFKRVNDVRGHAGGDAVLRAFAAAGAVVLRANDMLGRWGGEEWMLVLPRLRIDELPMVFARMSKQFAATPADGIDGRHGVTFSMGGAEVGSGTPNLEALIAACDERLYRAKSAGRDQLCHRDVVNGETRSDATSGSVGPDCQGRRPSTLDGGGRTH